MICTISNRLLKEKTNRLSFFFLLGGYNSANLESLWFHVVSMLSQKYTCVQ